MARLMAEADENDDGCISYSEFVPGDVEEPRDLSEVNVRGQGVEGAHGKSGSAAKICPKCSQTTTGGDDPRARGARSAKQLNRGG